MSLPAPPPLTFRALQCTPVSVPLANPVRTASGQVTHAPLILLDLLTEEGVEGRAYLFTYSPLVLKPLTGLLDALAALLRGQALVPHELEQSLDSRFRLLGNTGLVTMALAGIDMACWDALARAAGLPLCRLLGGAPRPVPAYFSQGMDGLERGVALAQECLARGFTLMKLKIGYPTVEEDLAVVRAVQATLGRQAELAVDYNQSLSVPEAQRRGRRLDELGLAWIEEPTRHDDDAGHARIARALHTPVMIGENWFGTHAMARSLAAGAADLVMPDLMKIGGVSGWQRAAALAHAARLPMASHIFQEVTAHLMTVTPTALRLEVLDLAGPLLAEPLSVVDGMAQPGTAPGSGLQWDAQAVARWRVP
jgi:mandelate racemase